MAGAVGCHLHLQLEAQLCTLCVGMQSGTNGTAPPQDPYGATESSGGHLQWERAQGCVGHPNPTWAGSASTAPLDGSSIWSSCREFVGALEV